MKDNKLFFELLGVYRDLSLAHRRLLFFLLEMEAMNHDVHVSLIANRLCWTGSKTIRAIDYLVSKKLVSKRNRCLKCRKKYGRIPEQCVNARCSEILVRQGLSGSKLSQNPKYLVKLLEPGMDMIDWMLKDHDAIVGRYLPTLINVRRKLRWK